jgi:uncharacterized protein (DUF302 family)
MSRLTFAVTATLLVTSYALAGTVKQREGWVVIDTKQSYQQLNQNFEAAVKAAKMGLVTSASASDGAKAAGFTIPGNRIIGVFRNDFARRMLSASASAGIEAPIRFYLTENPDGTATLSYKKPSFAFAPYFDQGGDALKALAVELDGVFAGIAQAAINEK